MPRPKKPGAGEPKKRSRNGCWPCKARKVKCGEEKPRCANCERQGETCDYSIRLNWEGRTKRSTDTPGSGKSSAQSSPHGSTFSFTTTNASSPEFLSATPTATPLHPKFPSHGRSHSATSVPVSNSTMLDMDPLGFSQSQTAPVMAMGGLIDPVLFPQSGSVEFARRSVQIPTSMAFDARFQSPQYRNLDYPSPSISSFDGMEYSGYAANSAPDSPPSMLPPIRGYSSQNLQSSSAADPYNNRGRSHSIELGTEKSSSLSVSDAYSPNPGPLSPYSPFAATPLTPNSSVASEEISMRSISHTTTTACPIPDRRLSVQFLTGTAGDNQHAYSPEAINGLRQYPIEDSMYITYGYDLGLPDLDTPKNDDNSAIAIFSPRNSTMGYPDDDEMDLGYCTRSKDIAFEKGNYYAKPVPIKFRKSLELPPILRENPMNLLYFHHFLNHTARILVPHDCEQNPFRQILPEMALHDENIMNLLLAFSASHRARLLSHPEPANRIALWVQDVFPKLRHSLTSPYAHESNETLMTAIMLASLEIISPNTFEVPISWQNHLHIARQMIVMRGGPKSVHREDRVAYFMSRWFAYLDVMGSLSGNKNDSPLGSTYWSSDNLSADEDFQIDCLLGFTGRCVGILARIAELAKQCENQRIDDAGNVREDWRPDEHVVQQAELILRDLEDGLSDRIVYKGCNHRSADSSESEAGWDAVEIYATNEMFHWAGLIHLYRRVLGRPSDDADVQNAVKQIVGLLYKVRRGSTAEACLLFPMFTAGCDARDQGQREKIMDRLRSVEEVGMTQVHRARTLMQKVWDTGKPWEALVSGEFFG